ncbi:S-adenosyl-l-methionine hydroxide adenosyltransferase family protein [Bacillus sp. 31A1R]|uniref:S-adenosyl-l-methionine hydroxide adenosyltransferase family protein n=1 Tax=Robertmurraya mangrovi TaxID=3098077 RepID=A0ABU5ITG4_9BACI|nr:S-adenosyl-l-methionine hydroxide adenosyltransferase family protein [Bacillus sp. 31A1R]MDZ5470429.1 S-adenosyl-l-methionine hydroxide adenosyltransferase family protein [Bacillus sp. 31A1R]
MISNLLVLQSDFGISDGAVSAMYGVANSVNPHIRIFDLTHDIPPFNIWEASFRLLQTVSYWPEGTVFVSVVDPGVGSERRSIVVKTSDGKFIITPDNGTLTHIAELSGIVEARIIDENVNRLPNSGESYTFHGRDIYAYTGARLASGVISFGEVGPSVEVDTVVKLPVTSAYIKDSSLTGIIEILDIRFGNLWTNINRQLLKKLDIQYGDMLEVTIEKGTQQVYKNTMIFGRSFAASGIGEPIVYVNSLDNLGIAINQGSFASIYKVGTGNNWTLTIKKAAKKIYSRRRVSCKEVSYRQKQS